MTAEQLAALVSIPAAIAVITTVGMFLKFIVGERKEDRAAYAEQRSLDRALIENHLSKSIETQAQTTTAIGELVTSIRVMQTENVGSMQWAREAMARLIDRLGSSAPAKD